MIVFQPKPDWTARLLDPWGSGSLAAFTVTTTLLSAVGFAAGWGLPL